MLTTQPRLTGQLKVPGDKSITHRALLFAALCDGQSVINGASPAQDCEATMRCLQQLGMEMTLRPSKNGQDVIINSKGLNSLQAPRQVLDVGNSGTSIRLLAGLLAGRDFNVTLDGDQSIRKRPMGRVLEPLQRMGAEVSYLQNLDCAPFQLKGGNLRAIEYTSPVASAQVQSAFLLAALQADGESVISLPHAVRDHTVRLFQHMGIAITDEGTSVRISTQKQSIPGFELDVPGDLSCAAYFMVAAALIPGSDLFLPGVGLNPGRRLVADVLQAMGADLTIENLRRQATEPVADIRVKYRPQLKGVTVSGAELPLGIDEVPLLALLGCFCEGTMSVQGASELRYKESDRLQGITSNLRSAGASIEDRQDGFDISGTGHLNGGYQWMSLGDHRLAMTGLIANLLSDNPIQVSDTDCIKVSYPSFQEDLANVLQ